MEKDKVKTIENITEKYMSLPAEKKMFVLGFMQGILLNAGVKKTSDSK